MKGNGIVTIRAIERMKKNEKRKAENLWPKGEIKLPIKLQIYHTDVCGNRTHEGETDMHPEDWVFNNNAERHNQISCGDPESEEHNEHECTCIEDTDDFEFKWENK